MNTFHLWQYSKARVWSYQHRSRRGQDPAKDSADQRQEVQVPGGDEGQDEDFPRTGQR